MNNNYTGRKIAIFTDAHALYEPTLAALDDMEKRGITEIYSLGDNLGVGPNPKEVINLLNERNVTSVSGNSEYYITLGLEPFSSYFNYQKKMSATWTLSKLDESEIGLIKLYPHFIELLVGGKKIGLCHFANDVRIDFIEHSTFAYQEKLANGKTGYEQFKYTNSYEQIEEINSIIKRYGCNSPYVKGYVSALEKPLFAKKKIAYFDAIVQGHVHFKIYEHGDSVDYYSIRAVGMAYQKDPVDTASYVILNEKKLGYEVEEVLVKFDREKMVYSILNCGSPDKTIYKFTNICEDEIRKIR